MKFSKEEKDIIKEYVTSQNKDILRIKKKIIQTCANNADKRLILLDELSKLGLVDGYTERVSCMFDEIIDTWEDSHYEAIRRKELKAIHSKQAEYDIANAIKKFGGIRKLLRSLQ